jgi:hypothetical protein
MAQHHSVSSVTTGPVSAHPAMIPAMLATTLTVDKSAGAQTPEEMSLMTLEDETGDDATSTTTTSDDRIDTTINSDNSSDVSAGAGNDSTDIGDKWPEPRMSLLPDSHDS